MSSRPNEVRDWCKAAPATACAVFENVQNTGKPGKLTIPRLFRDIICVIFPGRDEQGLCNVERSKAVFHLWQVAKDVGWVENKD